MAASRRLPVVVIMGATGSGKSKLALEIGRLFNGEIISADSMQIYKGLDIITNKVTAEERRQCPHHMIDYLSPLQEHNTIVEFRNAAIPIIDRILEDGKLPIVVGGTTYYIEALLWNFLINSQDVLKARNGESINLNSQAVDTRKEVEVIEKSKSSGNSIENDNRKQDETKGQANKIFTYASESNQTSVDQEVQSHGDRVGNLLLDGTDSSDDSSSTETESQYISSQNKTLHQRLQQIDPEIAKTIHPNDRRKVKRALEVYEQHGIPMSEILNAQKSGEPNLSKSGPLRYPHTCLFWIQSDKEVLNERINKRTDKMIEAGLVEELLDFHHQYNVMRMKENREIDYTLGIFQSIGFKEFHKYLILSPSERDTEEGRKLLQEGIENLKRVTRQYARKQISRIKGRFLRRPGTNVPLVYGLDATDVSEWEENVYKPAVSILTDIIEGREPTIKPLPYKSEEVDVPVYHVCHACRGKVLVTQTQLEQHLKSRGHQKRMRNLRKRQEQAEKAKEITAERKKKEVHVSESEGSSSDDDGMPVDVLNRLEDADTPFQNQTA